jgi:Ca-activated chloride channel family protein
MPIMKSGLFCNYLVILSVGLFIGINSGSIPLRVVGAVTAPNQVNRQSDKKIVLSTHLVNLTVTVTDSYGRFVKGLSRDQFEVYDDKVKQDIAHFSDEDAPVSLGIVYDVSGSMKERINRSLRALKRFVETSHDDDDVFLMAFNNRWKSARE